MSRFAVSLLALFAFLSAASAQTGRAFVRASGEGVVSIRPDQVRISIGVTTTANTAQESGDQNTAQVNAVLAALRQLLGPNADIRTVSYSVTPNYRFPQGGGIPTLLGYTTNNTVAVISADLSVAGKVIDAATQAGATTIQGLSFGLRDPEPARSQALRAATMQARAHAEAIALGLGVRLGATVSAEEASAVRTTTLALDGRAAGATTTPIEAGNLEVRATVVIEAQIAAQ